MKIHSFALTGGMGTGKSTVLKFFQSNGFTVYDADKLVAQLFINNHENYYDLALSFDNWLGTDFVNQPLIDKAYLRPFLEKTENGFPKSLELVTPFIQQKMEQLYIETKTPIIFEVPLLFEANMQNSFDKIILVTCNLESRLERISQRQPHLSKEQILQTISHQKSEESKKPFATYIIDNSFDLPYLNDQLINILPEVQQYYQKGFKNKP